MERLAAQDLMMLWPERMGWAQDIGALAVLDGRGLLDGDGRFRIEVAREVIEGRLDLLPRFRQVLYRPRFGLGWPLWVDAASIDLTEHVRVLPLDAQAGESQLLLACERLRRRPFNQLRPLWEVWFLPGLPGGRVGLFIKLHHAIADGVAGVAALSALFDTVGSPPRTVAVAWTPRPAPTAGELAVENVRRRLAGLGRTAATAARPVRAARGLRRSWPALREAFVEERAPRTSLNQRIGWNRRFGLVRSDLRLLRQVGHAHGGTVNDVLMAALAGGLRELLLRRGESVDRLVLRAFVPVSLHTEGPGQARGNLDGGMFVPLPVGEPDAARRLDLIVAETRRRKHRNRPPGAALFRTVPIQRLALRLAARQRVMNTYAANVPGPPVPLYFAGARLLEVFPIVPIMGNVSVGVGALSYAGQFTITAVADRELCPELDGFVRAVQQSLTALTGWRGSPAAYLRLGRPR